MGLIFQLGLVSISRVTSVGVVRVMHTVLRMDDCSPVCSLEYETLENYILRYIFVNLQFKF